MKATHRAIAALNLSNNVHDVIATAKGIATGMTNNPDLPTPPVPIPQLTTEITTVEVAETKAGTRAEGAVDARDAAVRVLVTSLHFEKNYVQSVADTRTPEEARKVIESAHMSVKKAGSRTKNDFEVKQGALSGSVVLIAKAVAARSSNEWDMSSVGGKTYTSLPPSLQAHTAVTGLTVLQTYMFRHRAVTKAGAGDWSQPAAIAVK